MIAKDLWLSMFSAMAWVMVEEVRCRKLEMLRLLLSTFVSIFPNGSMGEDVAKARDPRETALKHTNQASG
jgi:hypothetical protein